MNGYYDNTLAHGIDIFNTYHSEIIIHNWELYMQSLVNYQMQINNLVFIHLGDRNSHSKVNENVMI